jgi:hypothetical protein
LLKGGLKLWREFQVVLDHVIQPIADFPQFCLREIRKFGFNLSDCAHGVKVLRLGQDCKFVLAFTQVASAGEGEGGGDFNSDGEAA